MKKQVKSRKNEDVNKDITSKNEPGRIEDWEKRQDRYYMNLLNDLKSTNIDNEEMLDHLDDFRYPAY